jgi:hypothetical protein
MSSPRHTVIARRAHLRAVGICATCEVYPAPRGSSCDPCRTAARERKKVRALLAPQLGLAHRAHRAVAHLVGGG